MKNENVKFWVKVVIGLTAIALELAFDVLLVVLVWKFITGTLF